MLLSEVREPSNEALIDQSVRTSIHDLQYQYNNGRDIPMSEFVKVLLWGKLQHMECFDKQIQNDKRAGWVVEKHLWCGEPYNEFEIPSLGIFKNA